MDSKIAQSMTNALGEVDLQRDFARLVRGFVHLLDCFFESYIKGILHPLKQLLLILIIKIRKRFHNLLFINMLFRIIL
nr:hypothetical protein BAU18_05390 [Enterococcus diestrammenae]